MGEVDALAIGDDELDDANEDISDAEENYEENSKNDRDVSDVEEKESDIGEKKDDEQEKKEENFEENPIKTEEDKLEMQSPPVKTEVEIRKRISVKVEPKVIKSEITEEVIQIDPSIPIGNFEILLFLLKIILLRHYFSKLKDFL